jgi:hypothetical protein
MIKCRTCVYFSRALYGDCLRFGKRFEEGFYSALECRKDENKCGSLARWYLERTVPKKTNETRVHDSGAYDVGR